MTWPSFKLVPTDTAIIIYSYEPGCNQRQAFFSCGFPAGGHAFSAVLHLPAEGQESKDVPPLLEASLSRVSAYLGVRATQRVPSLPSTSAAEPFRRLLALHRRPNQRRAIDKTRRCLKKSTRWNVRSRSARSTRCRCNTTAATAASPYARIAGCSAAV